MGKYNFSYQRITELEERLEKLEKENERLRAAAEFNGYERRDLFKLMDLEKIKELCGYEIKNGELVKMEITDINTMGRIFQPFYKNCLRLFKPQALRTTKESKTPSIVGVALHKLTAEEYDVFVDMMKAIVDTLYYAKKKVTKE